MCTLGRMTDKQQPVSVKDTYPETDRQYKAKIGSEESPKG